MVYSLSKSCIETQLLLAVSLLLQRTNADVLSGCLIAYKGISILEMKLTKLEDECRRELGEQWKTWKMLFNRKFHGADDVDGMEVLPGGAIKDFD